MTKSKNYQKADVLIFKQVLENKFFCKTKNINEEIVKNYIKKLYRSEIYISGLNCDLQNEIEKMHLQEFGFKSIDDVKIEYREDVFNNLTKIILEPTSVYGNGDKLGIPIPDIIEKKLFLIFVSDTFERLKIKAENVINNSCCDKHIELYAKKNIQVLGSIFGAATNYMKEICIKGDSNKFFRVYVLNTYIYSTILFYQKMFRYFFTEEVHSLDNLKMELVNSIGIHTILEPMSDYKKSNETLESFDIQPIVWNDKINVLATLFYDLREEGKITASDQQIIDYICTNFIDKNGKPISKILLEFVFMITDLTKEPQKVRK